MDRLRRRWGTDAATPLIEFRLSNQTSSDISISPGSAKIRGMSEGQISAWGVWRAGPASRRVAILRANFRLLAAGSIDRSPRGQYIHT